MLLRFEQPVLEVTPTLVERDRGRDLVGTAEAVDRLVLQASVMSSSPLAIMSATIGVSIVPGQTALIRTPLGAYSSAALRVRPMTPCLEA